MMAGKNRARLPFGWLALVSLAIGILGVVLTMPGQDVDPYDPETFSSSQTASTATVRDSAADWNERLHDETDRDSVRTIPEIGTETEPESEPEPDPDWRGTVPLLVISQEQQPIAGAEVRVFETGSDALLARGFTDAQGRWVSDLLTAPLGAFLEVRARHEAWYPSQKSVEVRRLTDPPSEIALVLTEIVQVAQPQAYRITIPTSILGPDTILDGGLSAEFRGQTVSPTSASRQTTVFEVTGQAGEDLTITIPGADAVSVVLGSMAGIEMPAVQVRPTYKSNYDWQVTGRSGRDQSSPLAGAQVRLTDGQSEQTDERGRARIPARARRGDRLRFRIECLDYETKVVDLDHAGDQEQAVELIYAPDTTSFTFRFVDVETNQPVEQGEIRVYVGNDELTQQIDPDNPGIVSVGNLRRGQSYRAVFRSFYDVVETTINVAKDPGRANEGTYRVGSYHAETITVRDHMNKQPVAGVKVLRILPDGSRQDLGTTNGQGTVSFETRLGLWRYDLVSTEGLYGSQLNEGLIFDRPNQTIVVDLPRLAPEQECSRCRNEAEALFRSVQIDEAELSILSMELGRWCNPRNFRKTETKVGAWFATVDVVIPLVTRAPAGSQAELTAFLEEMNQALEENDVHDRDRSAWYGYQAWINLVLDEYGQSELDAEKILRLIDLSLTNFGRSDGGPCFLAWLKYLEGKAYFRQWWSSYQLNLPSPTACQQARASLIHFRDLVRRDNCKLSSTWMQRTDEMLAQMEGACQ